MNTYVMWFIEDGSNYSQEYGKYIWTHIQPARGYFGAA